MLRKILEQAQEQVQIATETIHRFQVERAEITSPEAAAFFNVPAGSSWSIRTGPLYQIMDISEAGECLGEILRPLLTPLFGKGLCICGLGNPWQVHGRLGPAAAACISARAADIGAASQFASISVMSPGTFGMTMLETAIQISSIVQTIGADGVLLIDAAQTSDYEKLCACIHVGDTGIITAMQGTALDRDTLHVPTRVITVPTALCLGEASDLVMKTTVHKDILTASRIIGYAVMRTEYPALSPSDLSILLKLATESYDFLRRKQQEPSRLLLFRIT